MNLRRLHTHHLYDPRSHPQDWKDISYLMDGLPSTSFASYHLDKFLLAGTGLSGDWDSV